MSTTETQVMAKTPLERIAWLSAQNADQEFTSLMHHVNVEALRCCFQQLDGKKAVGIDGITKAKFGENLDANLEELVASMKSMGYRPGPVRQVLIPKEGKPGATRPLGISNVKDKLIQKQFQELLEAIYDPIFLDCSYGFRPGRGCHDAIKALSDYLYENEVETVIDVDLANFFGTIDQTLLIEMLERKIKDTRFIRYIKRMFKAGMLMEGELTVSEEGVVQGSCCSPVLANIFAHTVIDVWFNEVVKSHSKGPVQMMRYADDLVIVCRYNSDAVRIKEALGNRLAKYRLKMNEDKTKLVAFSKSQHARGIQQGTFDFLGFTFYIGRTKTGRPIVKLKTCSKRFRSKLKKLNTWAREKRAIYALDEYWKRYIAAIRGHIQYYGVSHNSQVVGKFVTESRYIVFKWLNRRSQRRSFNWKEFELLEKRLPLPTVSVKHRLF